MTGLKVVFAGTPEFTLPSLKALYDSPHELLAVYTQPDRKKGRGQKLQFSAVKSWALEAGLTVYQPLNFKLPSEIEALKALKPDIIVVIAYGIILPKQVLAIPRFGCINVHASLLPRWRGASPIQQAILHGDKQSGVTIMQMDVGMDTGPSLLQSSCLLSADETAASLHDKLAVEAVEPLMQILSKFAAGLPVKATPQADEIVTYARKISKEDALIDWQKSAIDIDRQIRAFSPWPIAYTGLGETLIKIHQAEILETHSSAKPGTLIAIDKNGIDLSTGSGVLRVKKIQFPGGKVLKIADYLNSHRQELSCGLIFNE